MAKIIFEFDTEDDHEELELYKSIDKMYRALSEIYDISRHELKYGNEELSEKIEDLLEDIKLAAAIIYELD